VETPRDEPPGSDPLPPWHLARSPAALLPPASHTLSLELLLGVHKIDSFFCCSVGPAPPPHRPSTGVPGAFVGA
jgi:hypothetical protein